MPPGLGGTVATGRSTHSSVSAPAAVSRKGRRQLTSTVRVPVSSVATVLPSADHDWRKDRARTRSVPVRLSPIVVSMVG